MSGIEFPHWSRFRRKASEITDEMYDKEAAVDLVIQGFQQITETLRQLFLNYDFVATVPDLAGCMAHGETRALAIEQVEIAIQNWLDTGPRNWPSNREPAKGYG